MQPYLSIASAWSTTLHIHFRGLPPQAYNPRSNTRDIVIVSTVYNVSNRVSAKTPKLLVSAVYSIEVLMRHFQIQRLFPLRS